MPQYNGNLLSEEHRNTLVKALKIHYLPFRIFSFWVLFLVIMGILGFTYSLFTDEGFSEGLFENPAIKAFMMIIGYGFLVLLLVGVMAMVLLPVRVVGNIKKLKFNCHTTQVSDCYRSNGRPVIMVESRRVLCVGFSEAQWDEINAGYPVYLIDVNRKLFAMPVFLDEVRL